MLRYSPRFTISSVTLAIKSLASMINLRLFGKFCPSNKLLLLRAEGNNCGVIILTTLCVYLM